MRLNWAMSMGRAYAPRCPHLVGKYKGFITNQNLIALQLRKARLFVDQILIESNDEAIN